MTHDMTIPEIRERLAAMTAQLRDMADEFDALAEATRRRYHGRRTRPRARRMTPELEAQLRADARAAPDVPFRDIGRARGVDGGRVSESLFGKRGHRIE